MWLIRGTDIRKKKTITRVSKSAFLAALQRLPVVTVPLNPQIYAQMRADARRAGIEPELIAQHLVESPYRLMPANSYDYGALE